MRWFYMMLICLLPVVSCGQTVDFDGVNDYAQGSDSGYPTGAGLRSISLWLTMTQLPPDPVGYIMFGYGAAAQQQAFYIFVDGRSTQSNLVVLTNYGGSIIGVQQLAVNTTYHIVGTVISSTEGQIYINGALDKEGSLEDVFNWNTSLGGNARIGLAPSGVWPTNGRIDDVAFYNRVLSATEIKQMYEQRGRFLPRQGLIGFWDMYARGTQQGNTLADGTGLPDLSINNNTMVITNGPTVGAALTRKPRRR